MTTYKIVRFSKDAPAKTMHTGLTLEEAQEHCKREDTHKIDKQGNILWFDGWTVE